MRGYLYLEDQTLIECESFGAEGISGGELVFNTAMSGYQEMLTDPSYTGQILTLTYPMIGSYGVNHEDVESEKIHAAGMVVGDYVDNYSNFRAEMSLGHYLKQQKIIGLHQLDTRFLTRKIRAQGAMRAVLAAGSFSKSDLENFLNQLPSMEGANLVKKVGTQKNYTFGDQNLPHHVVVVDCGVKLNILRLLNQHACRVTVVPYHATHQDIKALNPDGVLFSNGPGDPAVVQETIDLAKSLLGQYPILGICLGHQILALALGAKTYKLKFGHHGANHPVKNIRHDKIEITSQNHGFAVDAESLEKVVTLNHGMLEVTHLHLSDHTIEGFALPDAGIQAIQFHPEAAPGPHDSSLVFGDYLKCIKTFSKK